MPYPAEYVIRIFKGSYPKLNFDKKSYDGKKICDIGCGVGRNLPWIMENTSAIYVGLDPNTTMTDNFWEVQSQNYNIDSWKDRVILCNDFNQIHYLNRVIAEQLYLIAKEVSYLHELLYNAKMEKIFGNYAAMLYKVSLYTLPEAEIKVVAELSESKPVVAETPTPKRVARKK